MFLHDWQELIGAALGPFLAVILSLLGYLLKTWWEKRKEREETLRHIEISVTQSLNDTYVVRAQLRHFVMSLRRLIKEIRAEKDPKAFSLERINFPSLKEVHRDPDCSKHKVRSYYLHNMLLFVDSGIREMNSIIRSLKEDFERLLQQNENLIGLMLQKSPNPPMQRAGYADNLGHFGKAIENYHEDLAEGILMMTRLKIFNDLLRKRWGFWVWWKMEGTRFKYFRDGKQQKAFSRNLGSMERIDVIIQKDVEEALKEAEDEERKRRKAK